MKKRRNSKQVSVLKWIFPDTFNSVAVALLRHYPALREKDMQRILSNRIIKETAKFIGMTATDTPDLATRLIQKDGYASMVISFSGAQPSEMVKQIRSIAADDFIDAALADESHPRKKLSLPERRR